MLSNSKDYTSYKSFFRRTDAKAPVLWPPDGRSQLTEKDPDAGKD